MSRTPRLTAGIRTKVIAAVFVAVLAIGGTATAIGPINDAVTATELAGRLFNQTQTKPPPPTTTLPGQVVRVVRIIDGDTIYVGWDENIRMLGYDTPERGECGYVEATNVLRALLASGVVTELRDGEDQDRYDRYLRHIYVNGVPVGLTLIRQGWANARYDSLDGYDRHIHQDEYRAADGPHKCGVGAD